MEKSFLRSKFMGAMIGSALGDAIGELAFRCHTREELLNEISNRNEIRYTDDTAMAIGLAESIIKNDGEIFSEKLGKTFHTNFNNEPYRKYGSGPPTIFRIVEKTNKDYIKVAKSLFEGQGSYGNGASMRIAPLGVFFYDSEFLYEIALKSAIVTHAHKYGIDAAAILAKLHALLVPKNPNTNPIVENVNEILKILIDFSKTNELKNSLSQVRDILDSNVELKEAEKKIGSGVLAMTSVPFSIYAFLKNSTSFQDCLLDVVLVSRDRDTVGAMVGGLLGSYLGIEHIPNNWISKLENRSYIKKLAIKLHSLKNLD